MFAEYATSVAATVSSAAVIATVTLLISVSGLRKEFTTVRTEVAFLRKELFDHKQSCTDHPNNDVVKEQLLQLDEQVNELRRTKESSWREQREVNDRMFRSLGRIEGKLGVFGD